VDDQEKGEEGEETTAQLPTSVADLANGLRVETTAGKQIPDAAQLLKNMEKQSINWYYGRNF